MCFSPFKQYCINSFLSILNISFLSDLGNIYFLPGIMLLEVEDSKSLSNFFKASIITKLSLVKITLLYLPISSIINVRKILSFISLKHSNSIKQIRSKLFVYILEIFELIRYFLKSIQKLGAEKGLDFSLVVKFSL